MNVRVIVNPRAGRGVARVRARRVVGALEQAGVRAELVETGGPDDAARLVREAHSDGVDCVAIVGGDGSLNEAAQAYIDRQGQAVVGPELALIPSGTGGDYARTLGLGSSIEDAVTRLLSDQARAVDLGVVELSTADGARVSRAFINILSFGLSGLADVLAQRVPAWLGGRNRYLVSGLWALARYRNAPVRVSVDGQLLHEGPVLTVAVAHGQYFGGGMWIAPNADPADGLFDVIVLADLSRRESLALIGHVYGGSHIGRPKLHVIRGRQVVAEPLGEAREAMIDLDGETAGHLPLAARVLSGALRVRV
ncbi:MAG: diacylglycerol kinase family lipid kinase [Polyangiaceae bacterium]|nr:diacylglycerol kinase family lipid kinase [Polyangiaceae bacterium]